MRVSERVSGRAEQAARSLGVSHVELTSGGKVKERGTTHPN
jgi:hypothetical protein